METYMETDVEMDKETEMDMVMEMETDNTWIWTWTWTWTWIRGTLAQYLIWGNSPYSAIRIVSDMSWCNFQHRFILVALLHEEKNEMLIFNNILHDWDCSLNDVLVELEISVWG
jgi:hypothetical protein